jgi:predicted glycoside hydrolase/deacetylase ChbG (UPF0249 family)
LKRLIVNADDFGLTAGVTGGIVEAMQHGVVSSTTAMVCLPEAAENIGRFANSVTGRIGLHLQLTDGWPCAPVSALDTLVDGDGRFPRSWRELGSCEPDQIRREWHAQIEKIKSMGIQPTHIDTHHHVHRFPGGFEIYAEIAAAYGLPARALTTRMAGALRSRGALCPDYCETRWPGGQYEPEVFLTLIKKAFESTEGEQTIELMCHPGFCDEELESKSTYGKERHEELRSLCDPRLRDGLLEMGIELITPSALSAQTEGVAAGVAGAR